MSTKFNIVTSAACCGKPSSIRTMDNSHSSNMERKESFMFSNRSSVISRGCFLAAAALAAVACVGLASAASASVVASELTPSDSSVNGALIGRTPDFGFSGAWQGTGSTSPSEAPSITNGQATVPVGYGGRVGAELASNSVLNTTSNSNIYVSFDVTLPTFSASSDFAAVEIGSDITSGATPYFRVDNNDASGLVDLAIGGTSTGAYTPIGTFANAALGVSHFFLFQYNPSTGAGEAWVDPSTTNFNPNSGGITFSTNNSNAGLFSVSWVNLDSYSGSPSNFHNFYLGTTLADVGVVPEPATLGLVAVGGLGLLLLKRRKTV
ncbi:MAG: PEP-CTERM sorting domain-containing protein [Phycisphaerae bacterium]